MSDIPTSTSKVSAIKSERTSYDLKQVSPDSRKEKAKGIYTREQDSIKPDEQKEDIGELELDKARYRLGEGISFGEQLLIIRGFGNVDAHYIDKNVGKGQWRKDYPDIASTESTIKCQTNTAIH